MPKDDLGQKLRSLGKNAPMSELQRIEFEADLGEGMRNFELIYHHARASGSDEADRTGGRAPVVLVHGTPSTLYSWAELIHGGQGFEGLAAERDVYALEIIGHGIAPGRISPLSFEACARFISAAIRALGLERVHLAGSSYGGEFVWRAALNTPELIASLVLLDSSGYQRRDDDWLPEEVAMRENPLAKFGWLLNSRERINTALAPHFDVIPPDRLEEFFLVCENAANWKAMVDLARDENGERENELVGVQPRTLILWGAQDIAYPLETYGRRFARDIPRAELIVLPETGHYPHEQRPSKVASSMNRFFDSVEDDLTTASEPR